ncbi:uncharacterized protein AKAME5_001294100 [Lates japonicus]|uniref:C3H1-type domain-containing protein n=1 Tax=Lates japonicus TaxID=270547 RepID=A0AAD3R8J0_LATJO|nr:uncharacterized protein AKAME5_001294100 [Lates japonicus]
MAFANLFTGLSAVDEDVQSPGQPTFNRNENDNGKRGNARKRKTQAEQTGPDKKKQRYQAHTHWTYNAKSFEDDDSEATHYRMSKTDSDHAGVGFTKEVIRNRSGKSDHKNWYHQGQNYKAKSNGNMKRQTQQKNQHQQRDRGRHASKAGYHQTRPTLRKGGGDGRRGDGRCKDGKQDVQVKPTRFMTQEFKDQNALLVDGQLLCRHFLWGRCIKADNCQLKHIQGYNDLIKEGADCRFSHEPLNEITKRLLDEALKRENDLYELAKKAEQETSGQPANTDESEITEANGTPDIPIQPLRPNFYNSGETNAGQEALLCRTEEPPDIMETAVPPQASDSAQPHSPQSTNPRHEEPMFSSPTPCGDNTDPSITQAHQQLATISSPKGSAVAATTNSVLKTLFLCLSPYQSDGEQKDSIQISLPSENEKKNKTGMGCVFVKQQQKSKRKRRQKEKLKSTHHTTHR